MNISHTHIFIAKLFSALQYVMLKVVVPRQAQVAIMSDLALGTVWNGAAHDIYTVVAGFATE